MIPCGGRDAKVLDLCIEGVRKHLVDVGEVYVVSPKKMTNQAIWIDESVHFPFNKKSIAQFLSLHHLHYRIGWYLQQLLKLYAPFCIEGLSDDYFVVDADTIFLNTTRFVDEKGRLIFNTSAEHYPPYFEHMQRLLPKLRREKDCSGITNCMLFRKSILADLFWRVERYHQMPFWQAFLACVDREHLRLSGASEYEIFFNFCLRYYADQVVLEKMHWGCSGDLTGMKKDQKSGVKYMSYHWYLRKREKKRVPNRRSFLESGKDQRR